MTNKDENGLLPCFGCRSVNIEFTHIHGVRWGVHCIDCDLYTDPDSETKEEAIAHWNTRAQPQNVEEDVDDWIKAAAAKDYDGLLVQFKAMKCLLNSQGERLSWYENKDYSLGEARLKELNASLESEREMNAELTAEVERLSHPKQEPPPIDVEALTFEIAENWFGTSTIDPNERAFIHFEHAVIFLIACGYLRAPLPRIELSDEAGQLRKERDELATAIIKIHEDQEGDYDFLKFISHPQYILAKKVSEQNG